MFRSEIRPDDAYSQKQQQERLSAVRDLVGVFREKLKGEPPKGKLEAQTTYVAFQDNQTRRVYQIIQSRSPLEPNGPFHIFLEGVQLEEGTPDTLEGLTFPSVEPNKIEENSLFFYPCSATTFQRLAKEIREGTTVDQGKYQEIVDLFPPTNFP